MSVEQAILEVVRELPLDKQQELLRHATQMRAESSPRTSMQTLRGLWADLNISLSEEEIQSSRNEVWAGFPRDAS